MNFSQQKTAVFIAWRYLFSKKKHNVINVISIVSMLGIMVSSAALIVVLSVFNGMEETISGWFNKFNPDFLVTLTEGKSFPVDSFPAAKIAKMSEVESVEEVVSDMVLATYNNRQELIRLKGVGEGYVAHNELQDIIIDGNFNLKQGNQPCAVFGAVSAGRFQVNLLNYEMLKVYYPKRTKKNLAQPAEAFTTQYLLPSGVFLTNTGNDEDLVFCPIDLARELMHYEGEVTSMEVKIKPSSDLSRFQKKLESELGSRYKVQNKYQQEATLFKIMRSEKFIIYVILAFILLVAAFNIIGSLGMLMLEKRDDMAVLRSMGAQESMIQQIFLYEGMAISLLGGLAGLLLGGVVCLIQIVFGVVKIGPESANYILSAYPVVLRFTDFIAVLLTILVVSLVISLLPTRKLKKAISKSS